MGSQTVDRPARRGAQQRVSAIIEAFRVRPAVPGLPNELHVRYVFRREAFIEPSGLVLLHRGEAKRYSWRDVRHLRIRRRSHDRRDFSSLELILPDQTVTFRILHQNGQTARSWTVPAGVHPASPDVLAEALRRYVPEDRILISALTGPPRSIGEWKDRRALRDRDARDLVRLRRIFWGFGVLSVIIILADFRGRGLAAAGLLVIWIMLWSLVWAVMRYLERSHRDSIAELDSQVPEAWKNSP